MKNVLAVLIILIGSFQSFSQEANQGFFSGSVFDSNRTVIKDARISLYYGTIQVSTCLTDQSGKFSCPVGSNKNLSVIIRADGYNILRQTFDASQDLAQSFEFLLRAASIREDVLVTTNRTSTILSETPASIVSLSKDAIEASGSPAVDDVLRQTVGFSLFRRSNSRNANPTTQGTSLRGINASGASRSIVNLDGIPLNDPFGGWVGWSKAPGALIEGIEIMRGGSSSLYGSDALGGAINLTRRRIAESKKYAVSAEIFGGLQNTFSGSTFFGVKKGKWSADAFAGTFQTKGYQIVENAARGAIDDFANSHNTNFSGKLESHISEEASLFFKAAYFGEARNNGTPIQKNRTHFRQFSFGGDFNLTRAISNISTSFTDSNLNFRLYGGTQVFDQKFSAVASGRNSEQLVRIQRVPLQFSGANGQFSTVIKNHTFLVGFETSQVRGSSNELGFFGGNATSRLGTGGREGIYGLYFQDFIKIGENLILVGNLRYDSWKNTRSLRTSERFFTNTTTITVFPERQQNAFSPSGSILFRASDQVSVFFNASRSFRAPTLNELYRGFRVGSVITDPNENLIAEKANNFESGMSYGFKSLFIRGNFYWTEVFDSIANVTLNMTPTLIFRQRQNAGRLRIRRLEIEAETKIKSVKFSFGYLLSSARFNRFEGNQALEGLRIPQVPMHQFTFQTGYANSDGWSFSLQGRAGSEQFENDLNTLRLEPYFQLDGSVAKKISENWQIFAGFENIFNSRYSVGRTPVRTLSTPFNARIGLRWN